MSHVLEHLPEPRAALSGVARALSRSGRLILGMPNFASSSVAEFGPLSWLLMPPEHLWYLEPEHVRGLLAGAGLEVVETRVQPMLVDALGPRRAKAQYEVCRRAGVTAGFTRRYVRATIQGLRGWRTSPPSHASIYAFSCRRKAEL